MAVRAFCTHAGPRSGREVETLLAGPRATPVLPRRPRLLGRVGGHGQDALAPEIVRGDERAAAHGVQELSLPGFQSHEEPKRVDEVQQVHDPRLV